jgi:hypothetical protein
VQVAQQGVRDGIPAKDRADADRIVENLSRQQKPLCPTATPTPTPTRPPPRPPRGPAPAPTTTAPASPAPGPGDEGCRLP